MTRFQSGQKTFFASSLLALVLPLVLFGAVYAAFNSYIYHAEKTDAYKIARHFMLLVSTDSLQRETPIPEEEGIKRFAAFADSFSLYKIKIFSASGMAIYSTRPEEVGMRNTKEYFQSIVAKGRVFQKRVAKDGFSAQGFKVSRDVIETYVPIMADGTFLGAVEVYTDISDSVAHMRRILFLVTAVALLLGASLLGVILIVDRRAARAEDSLLYKRLQYEHATAVDDLRQSEKRFHLLFQNVTTGMAKVLPSGVVTDCNDVFCTVLGRLRKQVFGAEMRQFFTEEGAQSFMDSLRRASEGTTGTQQVTVRCLCPGSRILWGEFTMSPMVDDSGVVDAVLVSCRDVATAKVTDEIYSFLSHSSNKGGKVFFASLARYLSELLGMDFVCIDKVDNLGTAQTLAVYQDGQFKENVAYSIKGTPCEGVAARSTCCYTSGIRGEFPESPLLQHLQAESYAGTPLWDSAGKPIGLIACVGRRPVGSPDIVRHALQLVALRASGELERLLSNELRARDSRLYESLTSLAYAYLDVNSLARMAEATLAESLAITGSRTGLVGYVDWQSGHFVCAAKTEDMGDICVGITRDGEAAPQGGVWNWALQEKNSMLTNTPSYVYPGGDPNALPLAIRRFVSAPAMAGETLVGQIALANAERDYDGQDLKAVESVATMFSLGVRRLMLESELVGAKEGADRANMAKSHFLATMSHEIRTPLNGVLGMLQLLQAGHLDEPQSRYVDMAASSARRLTRLLSDIIDLSKIESERLDVHDAAFSVNDLQESLVEVFSNAAMEKGLLLEIGIDAAMPPRMVGDALRVRQILFNLVGNALKFTDQGGVTVHIELIGTTESAGYTVRFTVSDTGIGIPSGRLKDIFDPFTQVDVSYERRYQGAGLGLAITRRLVDLMHGDVSIESRVGAGTSISVILPFRRSAEKPAGGPGEESEPLPLEGLSLRVLLAEDDEVNRHAMGRMLERMGHEVVAVADGESALKQLARGEFDLMLLDLQMPVMDGLHTASRIRQSTLIGDKALVPIIALTGHAMPDDRKKCAAAGMDGFVPKPVDWAELARTIADVLEKRTVSSDVACAGSYTDRQ
ncbi:MAG: ATP-binding protein [Desulfovibrionaceae bacterium]